MNKLSNQPPKGTSDWFPTEFAIRKYIFDTWRKVCESFGYEEYLTPVIESADVYRAKSGEDVGGKELMTMTDRAGRELAIRPEMTPSVTRMVSRIYNDTPKPIRYFSIANFLRNEKPQRGRNREFWQLNFDVFGSNSVQADVEVLIMAIEILKAFGATSEQFTIRMNDRFLIERFIKEYLKVPEEKKTEAIRILDKTRKITSEELIRRLTEEAQSVIENSEELIGFLSGDEAHRQSVFNKLSIDQTDETIRLVRITNILESLGYLDFIKYDPTVMRGLDYYDGMVFEVFDNHPENNRSMFGGGRYNGLAGIFGVEAFPAVGCAPGDETTKLFLEAWNLIPESLTKKVTYLPILADSLSAKTQKLAQKLRQDGKNIEMSLETVKMNKAFEYANKRGLIEMIIFGEDEQSRGVYKVKDMKTGEEKEMQLEIYE